MDDRYDRLNRWIDQLQAHQPSVGALDADPAEAKLFLLAAALMAQRPTAADPDPAFLARLHDELHDRLLPPTT